MAVRGTMSDIIAKVRLMVGDPAGASQQFTDQQVQDALDRCRTDVRYELLQVQVTLSPSSIEYLDYYSRYGFWESDYQLLGPGYVALTPASVELLLDTAHFVFLAGSSGTGQFPPVFLAGKTYDVYAASADLLEYWAATLARAFAFSADGASFQRNQQAPALQNLAALYRRQARMRTVKMIRNDVVMENGASEDPRRLNAGPVSANVPFITGD